MKIYGNGSGPIRPDRPADIQRKVESEAGETKRRDGETPARNDRVEISDAGRARADRLQALSADSPGRLGSIRERVLNGAYDADDVVAEVARRILDRGDV